MSGSVVEGLLTVVLLGLPGLIDGPRVRTSLRNEYTRLYDDVVINELRMQHSTLA